MNEGAPKLKQTEKQERLEAGGQYEIPAHSEHAPTEQQVASERQHMKAESRTTAAAEAPTQNVVEQFQAQQAADAAPAPTLINAELRNATKNRQLKQVQRQLPAVDRRLSKVIHQPVIRAVSEAAASTVSRPSGLLGGGLVAFVGSAAYLYFARHIGLPYNYFVFTLLFVGGFVIGLALEFIVWSITAAQRRSE